MFKNKAVLTALLDFVIGVSVLVVGRFAPDWKQFLIEFWAVMQPLALALIAYYAAEPVREVLRRLK